LSFIFEVIMSSPSRIATSRSLIAYMETVCALPNRPDLRWSPHSASRAGADIVSAYPAAHHDPKATIER
jgi:hypothetical protein